MLEIRALEQKESFFISLLHYITKHVGRKVHLKKVNHQLCILRPGTTFILPLQTKYYLNELDVKSNLVALDKMA